MKNILLWCDNEATVGIVKKGRSKCLVIMKLMRQLTWCACKYNFTFSAKHVPGEFPLKLEVSNRHANVHYLTT
jgi:hypothetical protein